MNQRSSHNWKSKSGTWDSLNLTFVDFKQDYPVLSSFLAIDISIVTNCNDYQSLTNDSLVSMFVDDYILERYWNNPIKYVNYYKECHGVMSPDFSLLIGMPIPLQQYNVYRNRMVGYIWQTRGINVIPTVSWSDEKSFSFAFNGIKKGSVVAVSNIGCRNEQHKTYFDKGFEEMKRQKQPKTIIFQANNKYKLQYQSENVKFIDSYWNKKKRINMLLKSENIN